MVIFCGIAAMGLNYWCLPYTYMYLFNTALTIKQAVGYGAAGCIGYRDRAVSLTDVRLTICIAIHFGANQLSIVSRFHVATVVLIVIC